MQCVGKKSLLTLFPKGKNIPVKIGASSDRIVNKSFWTARFFSEFLERVGPEQIAHWTESWRFFETVQILDVLLKNYKFLKQLFLLILFYLILLFLARGHRARIKIGHSWEPLKEDNRTPSCTTRRHPRCTRIFNYSDEVAFELVNCISNVSR